MGDRRTSQRRKSPVRHDPEALAWARRQAGRTQAWLALELGISKGHMSEIESGTRDLTEPKLRQAAQLLGCPQTVLEAKKAAA